MNTETIVIIVLLAVIVVMLLYVLVKHKPNDYSDEFKRLNDEMEDELDRVKNNQVDLMLKMQQSLNEANDANKSFIAHQLQDMMQFQSQQANSSIEFQGQQYKTMMDSNAQLQEKINQTLNERIKELQKSNEDRLMQIQGVVNEKLDKSLNERLDSSFKQIGDQLSQLYQSLGELNQLSSGVSDLNKTLSNVKTRGTWGEIQLKAILEQTMVPSQYDTNVITKAGSSDRVEFAIKIPSKNDDNSFIYLPVDSKMPADLYNKIVDASQQADKQALHQAVKELENRIKEEAKTIQGKYIAPPATTDFAVLFLPTEALYAEVLRIDGLAQWCQNNHKIILAGPTTITALLNSLRVGFSNLAMSKKSQEVLQLLQAIKSQYGKFDELIDKTQKKLDDAMKSTQLMKDRSELINRKMAKVTELDLSQANDLLGIEPQQQYIVEDDE